MNITIEKAHLEDIDELEMLYNDVCDYLETKEYNPGWRKGCFPTREDAAYFLEDDALYTAGIDGKIIASIALSHSPNGESNEETRYMEAEYSDILFIHIVAVHPDYLRKGIASEMLSFAEQTAERENVKFLRLYVYETNDVAIRTYEKNGYARVDKVDIGLGEYGLKWFYLYEKSVGGKTEERL